MNYLEVIADVCHSLLRDFPEVSEYRDYLDSRLNKESQEKFKIGYFPQAIHLNLLINEVSEDILLKEELIRKWQFTDSLYPTIVNKPFFEDHPLVFPYRDAYGNIVGFIGRTLLSDEDRKKNHVYKYKNTDFKKGQCLFGLYEGKQSILENDAVYIVEGQFDVIKAHEVGFTNIVAIGNSHITPYQFAVLCRYTKNINLLLDNDVAGDNGRKSAKDKFGKFANIKDWFVPDPYKDLDECIKENQTRPILRIKK